MLLFFLWLLSVFCFKISGSGYDFATDWRTGEASRSDREGIAAVLFFNATVQKTKCVPAVKIQEIG